MVPLIFPSSIAGRLSSPRPKGRGQLPAWHKGKKNAYTERKRMRGITRTLTSVMSKFLATLGKQFREFVNISKIHDLAHGVTGQNDAYRNASLRWPFGYKALKLCRIIFIFIGCAAAAFLGYCFETVSLRRPDAGLRLRVLINSRPAML